MACKYLGNMPQDVNIDPGDSRTPKIKIQKGCHLGRNPETPGWQNRCEFTPANGPCWFWDESAQGQYDEDFYAERR